jgi:hypothetical protein
MEEAIDVIYAYKEELCRSLGYNCFVMERTAEQKQVALDAHIADMYWWIKALTDKERKVCSCLATLAHVCFDLTLVGVA